MAITVSTQTSNFALTTGEQTLGSAITTGKTAVLQVDLNNMAAGDVIEINCYVKTSSGGTARLYFNQIFTDGQTGSPVYQTIPVPAPYSIEFKIVQPTGTLRQVDFVLMTID